MRVLIGLFLLIPVLLSAQGKSERGYDSVAVKYANQIDTTRLKEYLQVLASDSLMGRKTGTIGQYMAADYISSFFKSLGLDNATGSSDRQAYLQAFTLYKKVFSNALVVVGKDSLLPFIDFYTADYLADTSFSVQPVFLGYGIDDPAYSNYPSEALEGKFGVILAGEPYDNGKFLVSGESVRSAWSTDISRKIEAAIAHGITGLLIINPNFETALTRAQHYLADGRLSIDPPTNEPFPVIIGGEKAWSVLFPDSRLSVIRQKLNEGHVKFDMYGASELKMVVDNNGSEVPTANVYGVVKGRDYPDEYVFVTAHYDHLGIDANGNVYNGADDDGSGTSAVMEMARVMKNAADHGDGPKRSIVFMLTTGEEEGLLGSRYYVEKPIFPLDSTVTDLNIDMIGRTDPAYADSTVKYIYPIGSSMISRELNEILETVNQRYCGFKLDYRYDDPTDPERLYYRSDHYSFAAKGTPVIFFFRGLHADYHKPSDTIDKIEFETIRAVSQLIFHVAWQVANAESFLSRSED